MYSDQIVDWYVKFTGFDRHQLRRQHEALSLIVYILYEAGQPISNIARAKTCHLTEATVTKIIKEKDAELAKGGVYRAQYDNAAQKFLNYLHENTTKPGRKK